MTVYTVILNDHDHLRPPRVVEPGWRYVCFSDEYHDCPPWRIVPAPRGCESSARDSRIPKILSHLFFDDEFTIYHDASLQMTVEPSRLIYDDLGEADLALYRHPGRANVLEEMGCCRNEGIGYCAEMIEQVQRYVAAGVEGLYAGGVVIRRNTEATRRFNLAWWGEFNAGCSRDQIALPAAVQWSGVPLSVIDANIIEDATRFDITFHAGFDHRDNMIFEPERQARIARREEIARLCR